MKKIFLIIFFNFIILMINTQQNKDFLELSQKKIATCYDGIKLLKNFNVDITASESKLNSILTRGQFAYWICNLFNGKGGLVNSKFITKEYSYNLCVNLGIIEKGRGIYDSFTGSELIDTFSYIDYYVRYYDIKQGSKNKIEFEEDKYKHLPLWRQKLYRELDEERLKNKELKEKKKELEKQKSLEEKEKQDKIREKRIED